MFKFYLKRPLSGDFKYLYSILSKNLKDKCLPKRLLQNYFEEMITGDKMIVLTVYNGNRMAGFAYVTEVFSFTCGHYAEVVDFQTVEYYRKNGADVYLLRAVEQWSSQMLCSEIRFDAREEVRINLLERLRYTKDENSHYYRKRL